MGRYIYKINGTAKMLCFWIFCVFLIPHIIFYYISENKKTIKEDVKCWIDCTVRESHGKVFDLCFLLTFYREYRNLFYLRIGFWGFFLKWYLRPLSSLMIETPSKMVGAGTFIQHGFATIIGAEKIGRNCWINQQVTIGFNYSKKYGFGKPTIEDNVRISCGAKVLGKITVGEGSIIGANAVVVKDVPPHSVVIPSPTMVIKEQGESVYKKL